MKTFFLLFILSFGLLSSCGNKEEQKREFSCGPGEPVGHALNQIQVDRIIVIVLENEDVGEALSQPYLASLQQRGAYLSNYHGITHPSEPNYLAMIAGSTFDI